MQTPTSFLVTMEICRVLVFAVVAVVDDVADSSQASIAMISETIQALHFGSSPMPLSVVVTRFAMHLDVVLENLSVTVVWMKRQDVRSSGACRPCAQASQYHPSNPSTVATCQNLPNCDPHRLLLIEQTWRSCLSS